MLRSFGLVTLCVVSLACLPKPAEAQLRLRPRRANRSVSPTPEVPSGVQEVSSDSDQSSVPIEAGCEGTTQLVGRGKFTFHAEGTLTVDNSSNVSIERKNPSMVKTDTGSELQYDNLNAEVTVSGEEIELTLEGKLKDFNGEGAGKLTLCGRGSYRVPGRQGRIPGEGVRVVFGPREDEGQDETSPLFQARPRLSAPPEPQQSSR